MLSLFANETVTDAASSGFFPAYFPAMMLALVFVFVVVMILFFVGYRVIDKITPGDLSYQLLGHDPKNPPVAPHKPNVALAIVVASMVLGMSILIGLVAHGVLTH